MRTLPDYLSPGLAVLSIGLNPSLPSIEHGFYFANPRNRFWRALNASELIAQEIEPSPQAMQYLFKSERIGYTDLVKRPTANASSLRAADYREGAKRLLGVLDRYQPGIAWFHGKVACGRFLQYVQRDLVERMVWGQQDFSTGKYTIFVSPNPSPANAAFSLEKIVSSYNELAKLKRNLS